MEGVSNDVHITYIHNVFICYKQVIIFLLASMLPMIAKCAIKLFTLLANC